MTVEEASIAEANEYVRLANRMLEVAVVKARKEGKTWAYIGAELGVTHQGARSRWGKVVDSANGVVAQSANGSLGASDHVGGVDGDTAPGGASGGE